MVTEKQKVGVTVVSQLVCSGHASCTV